MTTRREVGGVARDRSTLFHLAVRDEWEADAAAPTYAPSAFASEHFIHCSFLEQLPGVYERYYSGRVDLVVLEIDRARLEALVGVAAVREEPSPSTGELFPHVHARLSRSVVRRVHDIAVIGLPDRPGPASEAGRSAR